MKASNTELTSISQLVWKVRYTINPHENKSVVEVKSEPFQHKIVGLGGYYVAIEVFFKKETGILETLKLTHEMKSFGAGMTDILSLQIEKDKLFKSKK